MEEKETELNSHLFHSTYHYKLMPRQLLLLPRQLSASYFLLSISFTLLIHMVPIYSLNRRTNILISNINGNHLAMISLSKITIKSSPNSSWWQVGVPHLYFSWLIINFILKFILEIIFMNMTKERKDTVKRTWI